MAEPVRDSTEAPANDEDTEQDKEIDEIVPQEGLALPPAPSIRKGAGRRVARVWQFVDGDRKTSHVNLKCCQGAKISSNATFIKKHFLGCRQFHKKFPAAVALFNPAVAEQEASTAGNQSNQAVMKSTGPSETMLSKSQPSKQSTIGEFYQTVTQDRADKLDFLYTNALLHDAMPFNALSSSKWKEFWHEIFHGASCMMDSPRSKFDYS